MADVTPGDAMLVESVEALHDAARAATGLGDFGRDDYQTALRALCRSCDDDADLTPFGRLAIKVSIQASLCGRLLSEEGWKRHPEVLERPIPAPWVIVGLPRTGTTAFQRLLWQDPQVQGLELWLAQAPQPRPPRETWPSLSDFIRSNGEQRARYAASPELRAMHEIDAALPDECWNLFQQCFACTSYECLMPVAGYSKWWAECDMRPVYRRHRAQLQLIGANEPEKRWLLKDATHLFGPEALFDAFPDARVIWLHRDPAVLLPSVCSLNRGYNKGWSRSFDPIRHGREQTELWLRGLARMQAARRGREAQFVDIHFDALQRDPIAAARRVYERFGVELTREAEAGMRAWRAAHPPGEHGVHRYSAEEFGLDRGELRERFGDYRRSFEVNSDPG
jgi:hypothetical protein